MVKHGGLIVFSIKNNNLIKVELNLGLFENGKYTSKVAFQRLEIVTDQRPRESNLQSFENHQF